MNMNADMRITTEIPMDHQIISTAHFCFHPDTILFMQPPRRCPIRAGIHSGNPSN